MSIRNEMETSSIGLTTEMLLVRYHLPMNSRPKFVRNSGVIHFKFTDKYDVSRDVNLRIIKRVVC